MEEKRNITSGDKLPGCERLTRPEEIKGLSKYLGAIRRTQEKWISENMPDTPLEEPIEDKVSKLPEGKETIDITTPEHLPENLVKLDPGEISLRTGKIRLKVVEDLELPKGSEKILPEEPESLPKEVIGIDVPEDKLKTGKERLIVNTEDSLPDTKVRLEDDRKDKLPKNVERIHPSDVLLNSKKEGLVVSEPEELPKDSVGLAVGDLPKLPKDNYRLGNVEHPKELPKDKEEIYPKEPDSLGNYIDRISPTEPNDLRQRREDISVRDIESLPDERLGINPSEPEELPSYKEHIQVPSPELPDTRVDINPEDIKGLPDSRLGINPEEINELPSGLLKIDVIDPARVEEVIDSLSDNELYEEVMRLLDYTPGNHIEGTGNLELAGIISAYLSSPKASGERAQEAAGKIAEVLEKQKRLLEIAELEKLSQEKTQLPGGSRRKDISDKEAYQLGSQKKMPEYVTPEGENPLKDPSNFLNPAVYDQDRYIRRLAEIAANQTAQTTGELGGKLSSTLRNQVLQQTLRSLVFARGLLERTSGMARDRLPGGSLIKQGLQKILRGGMAQIVGNNPESALKRLYTDIKKGILDKNSSALPKNRPSKDSEGETKMANSEEVFQETFYSGRRNWNVSDLIQEAKDTKTNISNLIGSLEEKDTLREDIADILSDGENVLESIKNLKRPPIKDKSETESLIEKLKGRLDSLTNTLDKVITGDRSGIALTLHDLCPMSSLNITNMEDLKKALIDSPYITTPWKLIKDGNNMTLDNNAYWELIIEPYLNVEENGGYSFLPSIKEINYENQYQHGHNTLYSRWIPISNFELQKTKLVSKSLGLYDGEINYPVSVEYTNELRITVVDDQYKSWRRYFQRCADVSTFFSEAHKKDFYTSGQSVAMPTAIDKSRICAAFYKNITFNIKVYCMNPQYSTIRKFDLLCVMKDFSDEWMGEIEGGGQDLSISFSVVGENPPQNLISLINEEAENTRLDKRRNIEDPPQAVLPTSSQASLVGKVQDTSGLGGLKKSNWTGVPDLVNGGIIWMRK